MNDIRGKTVRVIESPRVVGVPATHAASVQARSGGVPLQSSVNT